MKILDHIGKPVAIVLSVFVLIVICFVLFIHLNEKIDFQNLSVLRPKTSEHGSNYIKCQIFSNLGPQNYLTMEMAIPYENKRQYEDLNGKIDKIKSDMLTNIDQQEMNKWIRERDYVAIKGELLKIINKHSQKPIEHIYFDSFLYQ